MQRRNPINQISTLRELRGWSQAVLAAKAGCSQSDVSHYERGACPPLDFASNIAHAFGTTVQEVFVGFCAAPPSATEPQADLTGAVAETR